MAITAADVKQLREKTGAGMMDCKKALNETGGGIDAAVDFLRKKGLSSAEKKSGRVAAEGMVVAVQDGSNAALLEVNSETDFVSKNDRFCNFVDDLAKLALKEKPQDMDAFMQLPFGSDGTVAESLVQLVSNIGENIQIRRFVSESVDGAVSSYVHGAGKIAAMVGIQGASGADAETVARDVAMHVAAANPMYINRTMVDADVVARERTVLSERAAQSGKPEQIIAKIVEGQLNKFYSEICLLEQAFVKDPDQKVGDIVKALGDGATVVVMHRFELGEGIEKKEEDFAAEVAAQVNG